MRASHLIPATVWTGWLLGVVLTGVLLLLWRDVKFDVARVLLFVGLTLTFGLLNGLAVIAAAILDGRR